MSDRKESQAGRPPPIPTDLLAHPTATVELGPEHSGVRARTARPDERQELAATVPYLERRQALTQREILLVVLEPV